MHPFPLSRRSFLSLSGAAGLGALFPALGRACPVLKPDPLKDAKTLATGINAFAHDLHLRLSKDTKGSLFFSPFSIEAALAMTAAGARGDTLTEMQKTLHLPADPHAAFGTLIGHLNNDGRDKARGYELSVANAIWAQEGFPWHQEFTDLTRKHYGAGLTETNFAESEAARKQINEWVEKQTKKKIKDLIPKGVLGALTRMVLANAIYFKGTWLYQFDKKRTKDAPFTRIDGTKANVPLMAQTVELNYGTVVVNGLAEVEQPDPEPPVGNCVRPVQRITEVQVLEMPYAGKELSMLVFLPPDATGTARLAQWLTADRLANLKLKSTEVQVSLPRFKVETEYSLNPALKDLGMKKAFIEGGADFTGMSPKGRGLFISHVLHKAFVEVNEEGTEAAAATAVVVKADSAGPEPKVFRADRPFVFAIRDNATGTALFTGRYTGPT